MSCPNCGGDCIKRSAEPSAIEIHLCESCGHQFAVHCLYPIPEQYRSKHKRFWGTYNVPSESDLAKSYIKLKKILEGCEWFQPYELERQRIEGKKVWELGQFIDVEVNRINESCRSNTISIDFEEID